ncbi:MULTISPECIES: Spy/CpxP family protein refolding chaperone [unclassified Thermosynechococcus]|uniref:Spy/CpxP family protein refolding chaperone n=1 Tax=unclassified Thermosynechococcus TaxID=2622553 RepID=UPI001A0CBD82|nr:MULTISPECIES: Spy/CpxP family protein refolding chaperone [unclassified Thermosynechococcus]HIK35264.1 Spy/CpxP family protein refolding chaperone [Thermosynechococcus sp. M98_K2018_005]HIK48705.1 Spy/CpxP family protein refolding chaperone [Thermosynechococcus sp. M55_K2018_012]
MLKKSLAALLVCSALSPLVAIAPPTLADPGYGGPRWGANFENLNLTPEQRQRLQAVRQQYQGQMEQTRNQLRTAREELRQMMSGDASEDQIRSKHQQVRQLENQLASLRFESMLAMRGILTPQQRQALATRMQQRRPGNRFMKPQQ